MIDQVNQKTVVISQPMYFPWIGLFEQIRVADVFIFLDHVQFARGFTNRVQIKTPHGPEWMTVPLIKHKREIPINQLEMVDNNWTEKHLSTLASNLKGSPFAKEALGLMESAFSVRGQGFSAMVIKSIMVVCDYFELGSATSFLRSSEFDLQGKKSGLIKEIVQLHGGNKYVTGLGALNYLDHEDFESSGIAVEYMNYQMREYPQFFPPFTAFVSVLDLIANMGKDGRSRIVSGTRSWRDLPKPTPNSDETIK